MWIFKKMINTDNTNKNMYIMMNFNKYTTNINK